METKKICANCWQITRFTSCKSNQRHTSESVTTILEAVKNIFWGIVAFGNFILLIWFFLFIAY